MVIDGVGSVEIEFGVAEVQVAVWEQERVAEVGVEAVEEGGVVGAAGHGSLEGGGEIVAGVSGGEEAGVRRTAEGAGSDERPFCADGDAGKVGIVVPEAVAVGVAREGLEDDGVEIGVATADEEVVQELVLDLGFKTLGTEGQRVQVGREDGVDEAGREAEDLNEGSGADAFQLVVEGVVEVADVEDELLADDVLIDADVVGARALGAGGSDVELGDVGGVSRGEELVVEAGELKCEGGFLVAGGYVGAQFGAVEVA